VTRRYSTMLWSIACYKTNQETHFVTAAMQHSHWSKGSLLHATQPELPNFPTECCATTGTHMHNAKTKKRKKRMHIVYTMQVQHRLHCTAAHMKTSGFMNRSPAGCKRCSFPSCRYPVSQLSGGWYDNMQHPDVHAVVAGNVTTVTAPGPCVIHSPALGITNCLPALTISQYL
jgi:hypothetical protein